MSQCPILPAPGRLVVKPDEAPAKVGSLVIPDTVKANAKPTTGEVLAVGDPVGRDADAWRGFNVEVGDSVIFGKYSGNTLSTKDGTEYLILSQEDVLGLVMEV